MQDESKEIESLIYQIIGSLKSRASRYVCRVAQQQKFAQKSRAGITGANEHGS
jgi:hypothetical protein